MTLGVYRKWWDKEDISTLYVQLHPSLAGVLKGQGMSGWFFSHMWKQTNSLWRTTNKRLNKVWESVILPRNSEKKVWKNGIVRMQEKVPFLLTWFRYNCIEKELTDVCFHSIVVLSSINFYWFTLISLFASKSRISLAHSNLSHPSLHSSLSLSTEAVGAQKAARAMDNNGQRSAYYIDNGEFSSPLFFTWEIPSFGQCNTAQNASGSIKLELCIFVFYRIVF